MTGRAARRLVPNSSSLRRGFGWADSVAMSVSEKTYTFRAPSDLGSRAHQAVETLASLLDEEPNEERDEAMAAFSLVFLVVPASSAEARTSRRSSAQRSRDSSKPPRSSAGRRALARVRGVGR